MNFGFQGTKGRRRPGFFLDTDGRLYLYAGCSNKSPIRGVELDMKHHFRPKGAYLDLIWGSPWGGIAPDP